MDIQNKANPPPSEGKLFKSIRLQEKTFDIYYGYYEECDRNNPLCEPIPIYPDFKRNPEYTKSGEPFATIIEDACDFFKSDGEITENSTCADCLHFLQLYDWFGICKCQEKRENRKGDRI